MGIPLFQPKAECIVGEGVDGGGYHYRLAGFESSI